LRSASFLAVFAASSALAIGDIDQHPLQ